MKIIDEMQMQKITTPPPKKTKQNKTNKDRKEQGGTEAIVKG